MLPCVLLLLLLNSILIFAKVFDLGGNKWTLQNSNGSINVAGSVPSQAHLDLYAANIIPDPYLGLGDYNLRWVVESNWTYSTEIVGLDLSSTISTWLLFNGLDTFATIEFCGKHVAATNNQFRQYAFDVSALTPNCTSRKLSINFGSPTTTADAIAAQPGQETWPENIEIIYEFPNRQFIRKEQSDFGWDWGPAFAPAGVWQPAYIVQQASTNASTELCIRNSDYDISRDGQLNNLPPDQSANWRLNASIDVLGTLPDGARLQYDIVNSATNESLSSGSLNNTTMSNSTITGTTILDAANYELWWPHGMGAQKLYNLTVTIVDNNNKSLASINKRTGFRTIVLNMTPISDAQIAQGIAPGNNWHFEVNGHEFYAKGSNFIPPDAFWPRVTQTKVEQLFSSVVDANQNMLRVWASGAYTPDFIFDIADEKGVLMWCEFEFGDALYPANQDFLENVAAEAIYNVRRVNHHPSLALWAGGNELESLELDHIYKYFSDDYPKYLVEYEDLFLKTLLPIVYGNSKSISYIPSSTTNGYSSLDFSRSEPMIERYYNLTPGFIYGDTDYYNYDSSIAFDFSQYPVGRFANEFGYHSMPSLQTWQQVLEPGDLNFNSTTIKKRNHHNPPGGTDTEDLTNSDLGMAQMTIAAEQWYPVPHKTDSVANFSAWCHTTQIFQADFYKSEISFYRRGSGMPERQLGSLYWQLEDIWQAPSWAGIEYDGRWKILHYVGKDIYQPIIIAPFYNTTTGDLSIYVTSDLWSQATGRVNFEWLQWDGTPITNTTIASVDFTVGPLNTTRVFQTTLNTQSLDHNNAVLYMNLTATGSLPNANSSTTFNHENFFHAHPLADARLADPGIELSYNPSTKNFTIEATKGVAVWTWLDYPVGALLNFDWNAGILLPGRPREVGYTLKSDTTGEKWIDGVTVESLWNNLLSQ